MVLATRGPQVLRGCYLCYHGALPTALAFLLLILFVCFFSGFCPFLTMLSATSFGFQLLDSAVTSGGSVVRVAGTICNWLHSAQSAASLFSQRLLLQPPHCYPTLAIYTKCRISLGCSDFWEQTPDSKIENIEFESCSFQDLKY